MSDFKKFIFNNSNFNDEHLDVDEPPLFSSWNNIDSLDEEINHPGSGLLAQTMYFNSEVNEEEDVPFIPDIEELNNQDFIQQAAEAPLLPYSQLSNIEEISKNLMNIRNKRILPSNDNANVDITPLTKFCPPEETIRENDVSWTWNTLISDIIYNEDIVALCEKEKEGKNNDDNAESKM